MAKITADGAWCPRCEQTKRLEDFYRKGRDGLPQAYCKSCDKQLAAVRYQANPGLYRARASAWAKAHRAIVNAQRQARRADPEYAAHERARDRARYSPDRWIRTHYHLTREEWDALLEAQGGGCAICGAKEPGGLGRFHVDHDHSCCPVVTPAGSASAGFSVTHVTR